MPHHAVPLRGGVRTVLACKGLCTAVNALVGDEVAARSGAVVAVPALERLFACVRVCARVKVLVGV